MLIDALCHRWHERYQFDGDATAAIRPHLGHNCDALSVTCCSILFGISRVDGGIIRHQFDSICSVVVREHSDPACGPKTVSALIAVAAAACCCRHTVLGSVQRHGSWCSRTRQSPLCLFDSALDLEEAHLRLCEQMTLAQLGARGFDSRRVSSGPILADSF